MDRLLRLDVDGKPCGLRVAVATRWWSRARGLWPGTRWPAYDILKFPRCRAVHTFGMRVPLDVVARGVKLLDLHGSGFSPPNILNDGVLLIN